MDANIWLTLGIIGGIFLVTGVIVLVFMPKGKKALVMAAVGEPFEMQCAPADDKPYRLFARYGVDWTEGGRRGFGLVFDLMILVDGQVVLDQQLGLGQKLPESAQMVVGTEYFTRYGRGPSGHHKTASIALLDLGPRSLNSEIVVTGKVSTSEGTTAGPTKLYIAK